MLCILVCWQKVVCVGGYSKQTCYKDNGAGAEEWRKGLLLYCFAQLPDAKTQNDHCKVVGNLRMVGLDLETQGKGKQQRTPESVAAVCIYNRTQHPRHKGDCHHLCVVSNLNYLHVIRAECNCNGSQSCKPDVYPKGKHKEVSSNKAYEEIACRTGSNKQKIVNILCKIPFINYGDAGSRHSAEH